MRFTVSSARILTSGYFVQLTQRLFLFSKKKMKLDEQKRSPGTNISIKISQRTNYFLRFRVKEPQSRLSETVLDKKMLPVS